jgi:mannose-6-phosphate isomerase-like protein (cupin superfamily)
MLEVISFGENFRGPAPEQWGCINLEAAGILADPLVVVHHYGPGGQLHEHAPTVPVLCVCIAGRGFVKVAGETAELRADQAVIFPAGQIKTLWTTDSSITVLLVSFSGHESLTPAPEEWRTPKRKGQ